MIQKNRRSDSIVTNFYFTEPAWRLLQHNPSKATIADQHAIRRLVPRSSVMHRNKTYHSITSFIWVITRQPTQPDAP
jgi:hypothetical protein